MLRKIAEILKELLVLIIALTGIAVTVYMQYRWDSFGHRQRALIEEGDAELAASAFDSALTLYDRALEINPHNAEALKKRNGPRRSSAPRIHWSAKEKKRCG